MANQSTNTSVKTPRALGCYVFLSKPRAGMQAGSEPKYSVCLLWPKTTDLTAIKKAIFEAARSKFGEDTAKGFQTKRLRSPLRDGDEKAEDTKDPHFAGKVFINASSTSRPGIIDHERVPVDPNEVYSGCFFHAELRFYPYDKNGNKGVGAGLQNLMLVAKGPRIDGRKSAEQTFEGFQADTTEVPGGSSENVTDLLG